MKIRIALALLSAALLFGSCAEEHMDLPAGFAYAPPPTPTALEAEPGPERCTLSWSYPAEAMPLVGEFRVYEYLAAYDMLQLVGTTHDTVFVDSLLVGNIYYCYKVSAVDASGLEGWRTSEVCAFVTTRP